MNRSHGVHQLLAFIKASKLLQCHQAIVDFTASADLVTA